MKPAHSGTVLSMNSRLDWVKDWAATAKSAKYSVVALAVKHRVSTRQVRRFFRDKINCCPHQWMRRERMRHAVELIIDGQKTLKEIATKELGYESAAHFTRDFKEYFGVTPSHYRPDDILPLLDSKMSAFVK